MAYIDYIVGLDIGTTKICAIIAEINEDSEPKVIGVGTTRSDGLKKGVVVYIEKKVS